MTIRFTCDECGSVLKIKDELAGTNAKCPKCKTAFQIPQPESRDVARSKPKSKSDQRVKPSTGANAGNLKDLVDMPREVTPQVSFQDSNEFDVMAALGGTGDSATEIAATGSATDTAPKPSVAELMREHEEKMKEKNKRRAPKPKKGGLAEAAAAVTDFTSGSAADALTRNYDQKRGKSGDAPSMTREERREAEYKEGLKDFAIKAGAGVLGVLVLGYMLISYALSESMPDLVYVTGVVTQEGQPLSGVMVTFAPIKALDGSALENASTSTGYTNSAGEFVLEYLPEYDGALAGIHRVLVENPSGIVHTVPPHLAEQTVDPEKDNTFQLSL